MERWVRMYIPSATGASEELFFFGGTNSIFDQVLERSTHLIYGRPEQTFALSQAILTSRLLLQQLSTGIRPTCLPSSHHVLSP